MIVLLLATQLQAGNIFDEEDKVAHMTVSAMVASISTVLAREYGLTPTQGFAIGLGSALVVGAIKEASDKNKGGEFSGSDMMANFLGGLAGTSIITYTYKF